MRKDIHEITIWICNPNKTGGSGFKHLSGQIQKFRFLKPAVPGSAGFCQGVRGAATARVARRARVRTSRTATVARGGATRQGWRGAGGTRTACPRRRRVSPAAARAEGSNGGAARRRTAPAGGGARRRACTARERGPDDEGNGSRRGRRNFPREELRRGRPETTNRRRRRSSGRRQWWRGEKQELGFEGKGGRLGLRGEERSGRVARQARMAGAWREVGRRRW